MEVGSTYFGEIDLDEPNDENLLDEIANYFGDNNNESLVAIQLD